ncbi:MAG: hypothetical protein HY049_14715 [Acidobacteria bacterium]|nr:hypothetical protein [Acidobacteriota bacterium]
MRPRFAASVLLAGIVAFQPARADTCTTTPWSPLAGVPPLTDFPPGYLYLGTYPGFLYPGSNQAPTDHDADGRTLAAGIVPRDRTGAACGALTADCKIAFLSIGFSNNTIEFCGGAGIGGDPDDPAATACPLPTAPVPYLQTESFIAQALADPAVNHSAVVLVDGAKGGVTFSDWDPTVSGYGEYDRVLNQILLPSNLSEAQVQSIWVKDGEAAPTVSLATGTPGNPPEAVLEERSIGNILRAIRLRYPNARQVFISSRIYGGYANTATPPNNLNPEPYAYEQGFSIKWLVNSQIQQIRGGAPDPNAGDLDYRTLAAPWIAWGPYLWANATTPRSDGLVWENRDFRYPYSTGTGVNECTHPSVHAEQKVASMLLQFMKTSPYTAWFLAPPASCSLTVDSVRIAADAKTISWEGILPGPFDVVRGDLRTLHSTAGNFGAALCLRNNLVATSTIDPSTPPPTAGAYYLVRCDGATWDDGAQQGDRDVTLVACP